MVIEAVFEDRDVKAAATRSAEEYLPPSGIFASNTSTLPISGLAAVSARPASFVGLHFFSPVERMDLVEVIRGEATSDSCLAAALDYVGQIRKTPIVVKDSRGFYTSRTIVKYSEESCEMLLEGIAPAIIENIGRMIGMPMSPFALADVIGLDLAAHVRAQTRADLGNAFIPNATDRIYQFLVEEHGRLGRKTQAGFYDYTKDGNKALWPGLAVLAEPRIIEASDEAMQRDLKNRLLYSMALEAARCIEEGVVLDPREADVGALVGFGFPSWTGGPLSLIDMVGVATFVSECDDLADRYGERFRPTSLLRRMAERGRGFYPNPAAAHDADNTLVASHSV